MDTLLFFEQQTDAPEKTGEKEKGTFYFFAPCRGKKQGHIQSPETARTQP